jgi:hypothetical protein
VTHTATVRVAPFPSTERHCDRGKAHVCLTRTRITQFAVRASATRQPQIH